MPSNMVQLNPEFRKVRHAVWQAWRRLSQDKDFVWQTAKLKYNLTLAFQRDPVSLKAFFDPTFVPNGFPRETLASRIKALRDKRLRKVLRRYIVYVSHFKIAMRMHSVPPHFRTILLDADPATKYSVELFSNTFVPYGGWWHDDSVSPSDFFGSEDVAVGREMQRLIDTGYAKYVRIEDGQPRSLFKQLAEFAYSDDALTFVLVECERPYVFCLIGENISVEKTWREAGRVVSEFQKISYGRTRSGRRTKLLELKRDLAALLRGKGTAKEKAIRRLESRKRTNPEFQLTEKNVYSKMSDLSQTKRKLRI